MSVDERPRMDGTPGLREGRTPELERLMNYFVSLRGSRSVERTSVNGHHPASGLIPLLPDQFIYAVDYTLGELFLAEGFERVLGYPDQDINLERVFAYIHPDDLPAVTAIVERALRQVFASPTRIVPFSSVMSLDYRFRKANGEYIKILRQVSVLEYDPRAGRVISTLSICKDISNIKQSNHIGWQATGPGTEKMDMSDILPQHGNVLYRPSAREMDVLAKLAEGKNSTRIGSELGISSHTVNTHRKNLLQRTGCKNVAALIARATEQGWT